MNAWELIVRIFNIIIMISGVVSPLLMLYMYFQAKTKKVALTTATAAVAQKTEAEKAELNAILKAEENSRQASYLKMLDEAESVILEEVADAEVRYGTSEILKPLRNREVKTRVRLKRIEEGWTDLTDEIIDALIEKPIDISKKINKRTGVK